MRCDLASRPGSTSFAVSLAAVLAGGEGRRMGGVDKAEVRLGGVPLILRVWEELRGVARRVVVVGGRPHLESVGVPTVEDEFPGANSLGGIATALRHAAGLRARWVLCVGCDMPFLSADLIRLLSGLRRGADLVVPLTAKGYEPLCAFYRVSCLPEAERQIASGDLRVMSLFRRVRTREVPEASLRGADPELLSFFNANRPGDLKRAAEVLTRLPLSALRRT